MDPNLGGPLKENMYSPLRGEGGLECARGKPRVSARAGNDQPDADARNGPSRSVQSRTPSTTFVLPRIMLISFFFFFFHDESLAISNAIPKRLDVVLSIKQHLLRSLVVYL